MKCEYSFAEKGAKSEYESYLKKFLNSSGIATL